MAESHHDVTLEPGAPLPHEPVSYQWQPGGTWWAKVGATVASPARLEQVLLAPGLSWAALRLHLRLANGQLVIVRPKTTGGRR